MTLTVNTNIMALNAQRSLLGSQNALQVAMQRLSSGLRINSARDDAAGLAIADRLSTQVRGLNRAMRNANDGVSLAQTGEGGLAEITANLQRIRELALQSANASNSTSDRITLDLEVQQRIAEIDRIAAQTSFNGRRLFDGSFGNAIFQVGANVGETVGINLTQSLRAFSIGQIAQQTSTQAASVVPIGGSASTTATIQVGGSPAVQLNPTVAGPGNGQSAFSAWAKANAINGAGIAGLTVQASTNIHFSAGAVTGTGNYSLRINGIDIFNNDPVDGANPITVQQIVDAINAQQVFTGVTAQLGGGGTRVFLTAADGRDIAIAQTGPGGGISGGTGTQTLDGVTYYAGVISGTLADANNNSAVAAARNGGRLTLTANENIVISGTGAGGGAVLFGFGTAANFTISRDAGAISAINVRTVAASNTAVFRVDSALAKVNELRAQFGAIQNRFESAISTSQANVESLTQSRSRIMDADFAAETTALSRAQILQQSAVAMVAQANQLPQSVLALLR